MHFFEPILCTSYLTNTPQNGGVHSHKRGVYLHDKAEKTRNSTARSLLAKTSLSRDYSESVSQTWRRRKPRGNPCEQA